MQGRLQDTIGRSSSTRARAFLLGAMLGTMLAAGLAGTSLAQPQERSRADLEHPLPPMRLAALLEMPLQGAFQEHGRALRSERSRADSDTQRVDPASSRFAPVLANRQNVFGSVAVGMAGIAASGQWRRVIAEDAGRFFRDGCGGAEGGPCDAPGWSRWTDLHRRASMLAVRERIGFVNREVNRLVRYRDDQTLYGRSDHWATLTETIRNGAGDCEDHAIAKMWLLEALGVPLASMQLVALRDQRRGLDHAVLAVHLHDQILLLDNAHDRVLQDVAVGHYKPMFSFAGDQSFVHGFRRPADRLAAATPR